MEIDYLPKNHVVIESVAKMLWEEFGRFYPDKTSDFFITVLSATAGNRHIPMTLVGRKNSVPVASASIVACGMKHEIGTDLTPWMSSVCVRGEYRGKGLGRTLCRRVISELSRLGIPRVYLHTPDKETFYQYLGWYVIRRVTYRGQEEAIMARDVK